MQVSFCS